MIHGRTDGNTGGHLVIQQTSDPCSQHRLDTLIRVVVGTIRCRVYTTGEIPFNKPQRRNQLLEPRANDDERFVPERLRLKRLWFFDER